MVLAKDTKAAGKRMLLLLLLAALFSLLFSLSFFLFCDSRNYTRSVLVSKIKKALHILVAREKERFLNTISIKVRDFIPFPSFLFSYYRCF